MFVRVVESGNFTAAAAAASSISATMVAKYIRTTEERLGARLLHRTTRRQQLTEVAGSITNAASACCPKWSWPMPVLLNYRPVRAG
jgi:DNA-binding transcriptional LysR family regulator